MENRDEKTTHSKESSINVTVRVRPFTPTERNNLVQFLGDQMFLGDGSLSKDIDKYQPLGIRNIINVVDDKMLIFDPPETNPLTRMHQKAFHSIPNSRLREHRFVFDKLFNTEATQVDVFQDTTKSLLTNVLDGFNATVFAYGATGCGKTHTIVGTSEDPGIIFLTMRELYAKIEDLKDTKVFDISLSFLEIYNETIKDLLNPETNCKKLAIREDSQKRIKVSNLSKHKPQNVEEVMQLIIKGNTNRTVSPTEANLTSSRSHAILQINIIQKNKTADLIEEHTFGTLSIIDLAGSERACGTKNRGARLNEGANINKSLLALGNCINALCDSKKKRHIPYRDSKLTRLLKFSLDGNCKTVMIVCISPGSNHYDETLNTLKYANRAKEIKTKIIRNQHNLDRHVGSYLKMITEQKQEIDELKAKQETIVNDIEATVKSKHQKILSLIIDKVTALKKTMDDKNQDKWRKCFLLAKRKILLVQKNDFQRLLNEIRKDNLSIVNGIEQVIVKLTVQIKDLESQYYQRDDMDNVLNGPSILNRLKTQEYWTDEHGEIVEHYVYNLKESVEKEILFNSSILYDQLVVELNDYNFATTGFIKLFNNMSNKENIDSPNLFEQLEYHIHTLINGDFDQFLETKASAFLLQRVAGDSKRINMSPLKVSPPRSNKKNSLKLSPLRFKNKKVHFDESDLSIDESMMKSDDDSPLQNSVLENLPDLDVKFETEINSPPIISKIYDYKKFKPRRISSLNRDKGLLNKRASRIITEFNSDKPSHMMQFNFNEATRNIESNGSDSVE